MSLINSKLCKFEIDYAIFFSIIYGNTIIYTSGVARRRKVGGGGTNFFFQKSEKQKKKKKGV